VTASAIPTKKELRARVSAARRAMSPQDRATAGAATALTALAIVESLSAGTVAAYLSIGTEPATPDLVEALRSRGVRVLAPVLLDDLDLDWAAYDGPAELAPGPRRLWAPTGPRLGRAAVSRADLVIVPALAVDGQGRRLGRGGGCYDRALVRVPAGRPVVALLYDGEVLPAVPSLPHDRPVTAAITPSGMHRFA
jgi:5-formyltetrahydrofolate cyclo-ligase